MDYQYPVRIKEIPEVIVASMRRAISGYERLFDIMPEMGEAMQNTVCD